MGEPDDTHARLDVEGDPVSGAVAYGSAQRQREHDQPDEGIRAQPVNPSSRTLG
jgi:hypothetical protein